MADMRTSDLRARTRARNGMGVIVASVVLGFLSVGVASAQQPPPTGTTSSSPAPPATTAPAPVISITVPPASSSLGVRDLLVPAGTTIGAVLGAVGVWLAARATAEGQDRRTRAELAERARLQAHEERIKVLDRVSLEIDAVVSKQSELIERGTRGWGHGDRSIRHALSLRVAAIEARLSGLDDADLRSMSGRLVATIEEFVTSDDYPSAMALLPATRSASDELSASIARRVTEPLALPPSTEPASRRSR